MAILYKGKLESSYYNRGLAYLKIGEIELAKADFESLRAITTDEEILKSIDSVLAKLE
jgi:hypothetical protein